MNCVKCGAPLPPKSDVCEHCNTLNDTDLRKLYDASVTNVTLSDRICPRCNIRLHTIGITLEKTIYVERCKNCLGIFFDPMELEDIIVEALKDDRVAKREGFFILIEEGRGDRWPIKYIKCPVCRELMGRTSYGEVSGVLIDWCRQHGIWLDGGELGKILTWKRSGGVEKKMLFDGVKINKMENNLPPSAPSIIKSENDLPPSAPSHIRYEELMLQENEEKDLMSKVLNFIIKLF